MGHSKLSVTIPDDIYNQIIEFASWENIKLSHFVSEALAEKLRMVKEKAYIRQINEIFEDKEVTEEQPPRDRIQTKMVN